MQKHPHTHPETSQTIHSPHTQPNQSPSLAVMAVNGCTVSSWDGGFSSRHWHNRRLGRPLGGRCPGCTRYVAPPTWTQGLVCMVSAATPQSVQAGPPRRTSQSSNSPPPPHTHTHTHAQPRHTTLISQSVECKTAGHQQQTRSVIHGLMSPSRCPDSTS